MLENNVLRQNLDSDPIYCYIQGLDFNKQKILMKESGNYESWPEAKFDFVEQQYKNYLYLCKVYPEHTFPPSEDIDKFWHEHILNTERYTKDCNIIFGKYKHHYPKLISELSTSINDNFNTLQEFYKEFFGTYIYEYFEG
jgi:hypothetical protein